jgi:DNA-binding response OmpR family regulator
MGVDRRTAVEDVRLRHKIDRAGEESLIQTVRGRGYALRAC